MKFLISLLALTVWCNAWADLDFAAKRATYSAAVPEIALDTAPTDVCVITGSASKTIYLTRVELSSLQTTAGVNSWYLVKRTAAHTSGTKKLTTIGMHDSQAQSAGASTYGYTGNPNLGSVAQTLKVWHLFAPAAASVATPTIGIWDFQVDGSKRPIVLRGTGESVAINFNGASKPTGLVLSCNFSWYEE